MKRFNRILAALLAALMLCGPCTTVAEMNVELEINAPANPGSIELEIDPESGANIPDGGLALDDGLQLDNVELPNPELEIGIEDNLLIDGAETQGDEPVQSNDSDSDFVIENDVLVEYTGDGGDVVIPDGVKKIGNQAFYGCDSLTSVTIPGSVTEICDGYDDFDVDEYVGAFYSCTNLKQVTFSNGLTHIGYNAFYYCTRLTSVTIPDSVTSIGVDAFGCCDHLETINVAEGNLNYTSKGGILYTHDMKTLLQCPGAKTSVTIPNSVTSIGAWAFEGCASLSRITIPNSVTRIEEGAFCSCDSLSRIIIPDSVTSIGEYAFYYCDSLTSVTIPNSVTSIGEGAFSRCKSLTSVTILAKKITIYDDEGDDAFYGSHPTFHIISGSDAIDWAEENGYNYDIVKDGLSEKTLKLVSGKTHQLNVYDSGKKVSNAAWTSSDTNVATVDNGKVTAKKVGKCVISATLESGRTFKCKVTVYDPAEISDTTLTLNLGETYKLKVTGLLKRKVTWTSSNTSVATVKNGKITPKKAGKCTITAILSKGKYLAKKTLKCKLTVTDPAALSAEKLTISTIDSDKIKLTGALKRKVTWSTSDDGVVKITKSDSSTASIKAVKTGTATITAKIEGGKTLKCAVTVVNPLTIKEDWDEDFDDLASWEVGVKFTNHSNKKIIYVTFDILQYNNRGDRLKSPYDYYYFNNDIDPHSSYWDNYQVNDDTRSVKFKITEVTFADKTTWRP